MNGHILQFAVAAGEATPDARRLRMIGVFSEKVMQRRMRTAGKAAQTHRPRFRHQLTTGTEVIK